MTNFLVLEILKGRKTQSEIASKYGVHPSQQNRRIDEFMKAYPKIFTDKRSKENETDKQKIVQLERMVGQYAMEVDWIQKKLMKVISYSQKILSFKINRYCKFSTSFSNKLHSF